MEPVFIPSDDLVEIGRLALLKRCEKLPTEGESTLPAVVAEQARDPTSRTLGKIQLFRQDDVYRSFANLKQVSKLVDGHSRVLHDSSSDSRHILFVGGGSGAPLAQTVADGKICASETVHPLFTVVEHGALLPKTD